MTKEEIINKNNRIKNQLFILKGGFVVTEKKKIAKDFDELSNQFESVNQKFDYTGDNKNKMDNTLNLTKLENIDLDKDDISELAKDSLRDYYTSNVNSINSKNKNSIENLQKSIEKQIENANNQKNSVNNTIENVKQDASNDALKRGLARSSIVINKLNAFDNAKIEEYNRIDKELTNSVNEINNQINELNKEKEDALSEFNITYASKLNEKINSLNKELQEKQAEITKYNNEIAQAEAKFERDNIKENNEIAQKDLENYIKLSDFVTNYGLGALDTVKNNEKYEYAYDYFMSIPKDDAEKLLSDYEEKLKHELGVSYYNQLVRLVKYD